MNIQTITPGQRVRLTFDAAEKRGFPSQGLGVVSNVDPDSFWVELTMAIHGTRRFRAEELELVPNMPAAVLVAHAKETARGLKRALRELEDVKEESIAKVPGILARIRSIAELSDTMKSAYGQK